MPSNGKVMENNFLKLLEMNYSDIKYKADKLSDFMIACRRHIHSNPELSFQEHATSEFISGKLTEAGIPFRKIADTGILAKIEGKDDLRNCVVLRADIDALPVEEKNEVEFCSKKYGVMHACGHDMHAAALLGAMVLLNDIKDDIKGTVFGLFQPGEERCPGGASMVLGENPFEGYDVRAVVGEHVAPELPVGTVGFREGKYMASSEEVHITVRGKGGHAALTHQIKDPVVAAAAIITSLQQIVSRNADNTIPTVLSIGRVIADGSTNIIPSEVHMDGTLRTMDENWRKEVHRRIKEIVEGTAVAYGVTADAEVAPGGYPNVVNDVELTRKAREVAIELLGENNVVELGLRMTGEDFGHYTVRYPGIFFRLGTARSDGKPTGELHTPFFNPDEKALAVGTTMMSALAFEYLKD